MGKILAVIIYKTYVGYITKYWRNGTRKEAEISYLFLKYPLPNGLFNSTPYSTSCGIPNVVCTKPGRNIKEICQLQGTKIETGKKNNIVGFHSTFSAKLVRQALTIFTVNRSF
jgi:hypothetical protein